ncbi:aspartate/glutamate racemase family protein [Novosphingobium pituita]|uniref:Aspartate/glutamate racemase family protein n=1 Tax=Novosphingobium pituita TaxID=3056842 RepID=A0ABQ6P4C4_9SPHN|nr:amino acid racemase [Novosphingobium sp. IK01]MDK4806298.1 amino acid racemase [Novosphingobium aromaticivorans]GMM60085.1 aspartate/glutamate racemase family protein [Novosphingobium sp. IK01]HIQ16475.1 amino acid racemase [Novosphingobium capsulatum]
MRKIGLIGGMSWVSTRTYYDHINKLVQGRTSTLSSAPLIIESLDFAPLARLSSAEEWARAALVLVESAQRLAQAGASAILIGANSMHKVYDKVAAAVDVPVIHIADAVGARMQADGVTTAALIGSRNVMVESFYRKRLVAHGVTLLPPVMDNVEEIDRIIYEELMQGRVTRAAERTFKTMITSMDQAGAQAVVLGCTELDTVIDVDANVLPIYDGARIHAEAAVGWIMGDS